MRRILTAQVLQAIREPLPPKNGEDTALSRALGAFEDQGRVDLGAGFHNPRRGADEPARPDRAHVRGIGRSDVGRQPALGEQVGRGVLRKEEVPAHGRILVASGGAAAVELPEPQREHDHVGRPHHERRQHPTQ